MAENLTPWQEELARRIIAGERVVSSAGRMHGKHSALVEFADGEQVVAPRYAVRRAA